MKNRLLTLIMLSAMALLLPSCVSSSKLKQAEATNKESQEKLKKLNQKYRELASANKELKADVDSLTAEGESLTQSIDSLEEQIFALKAEHSHKKDSIAADSQKKVLFKKIADAQKKTKKKQEIKNKDVPSALEFYSPSLVKLVRSLVGEGVTVIPSSIKANNSRSSKAYGYFKDSTNSIGIQKGLLMTTGSIKNAKGPNLRSGSSYAHKNKDLTDLDLNKIIDPKYRTYDACVIEFDIIPYADTLSFNFVFGSEEYDEYVFSKFDDVFAFYISGPGLKRKKNMAKLPDNKTIISINNINQGSPLNPEKRVNGRFHVRNTLNENPNIGYDGYTRVLKIRQRVLPRRKYHLKLAIADVSDRILDSGLFIEGRSLISYYKEYQLLFSSGSASLDKAAIEEIQKIVTKAKSLGEDVKIEVEGHTDDQGTIEANLSLSQKRVNAVVNQLAKAGIKEENFKKRAWGEKMPRVDNDTPEGMASNRRVEVRILGLKKKAMP
ncbi:MAG: choice-of-anchor L domain-containing protein [Bacteroidia bacterium]|nr:choice-of-anchor L domain-containing protein [Bacteroidia bacterium]